jgi:hypothetical protein
MPWGVAAAAVAAGGSYMSAKEAGKGGKVSSRPPEYIERGASFAVDRATEIANRPYERYQGNRVSDLSGNERTGIDMARSAVTSNDARGYLDKAGASIDGVTPWGTETMEKYMNPYVSGVLDQSLKRENEAFSQRQVANKGRSAAVGAFGSDRAALIEASETGRHLDAVGDITARGYDAAFRQAADMWRADNDMKLRSADAYRAVGGDINRLNSEQITDLLRTGGADRMLQQMQLDVDYNDFIEQRDWDITNLQPLLSTLGAAQGGGTTSYQGPKASGAGQALGAAAALIGYYGQRQSGHEVGHVQETTQIIPGQDTTIWRPTIDGG